MAQMMLGYSFIGLIEDEVPRPHLLLIECSLLDSNRVLGIIRFTTPAWYHKDYRNKCL